MYEMREEEIICSKTGNPTTRIARFLKPNARNINKFSDFPKTPLVSDYFTLENYLRWPLNVHFTSWNQPDKTWLNWFNKLVINHASTWIEAGIYDGILASLHEIPLNKELVLGICEFWCPKTSSFLFPWGEATITLEDVMIVGGFPVIGLPFNTPIQGNLVNLEDELKRARWEYHKGTHSSWIEYFMEGEEGEIEEKEGEFEHVAFLSLWLSRFVLPDLDEGKIGNYVFPIAIHLSQGTPIALASVVLANLYNEMTLLTLNAVKLRLGTKYFASGLFKIVQVWVCERFPEFGSKLSKQLGVGDPRIARWDNVKIDVSLEHVRSRLKVGEGFRWRPYASDLENWDHFPFYEESEQTISDCAVLDDCLLSYGRFLCSCVIHGHKPDVREKYQPQRVAMQFGYDQEIPAFGISDVEWDKKVGLYIPARTFDPGMSICYCNWWKDSMLGRKEVVDEYFKKNTVIWSSERLVAGQDGGNFRHDIKGNGSCASPQLMPETCVNESRDVDNDSLAMRICSTVATENASCNEMARGQASAVLNSPKIKFVLKVPKIRIKGPRDINDGKEVSVAKKHKTSIDFHDIDHVPLAMRHQSMIRSKETLKPSESDVGNSLQRRNQAEGFASPASDADSHITRKGSTSEKTTIKADRENDDSADGMTKSELIARVAMLESLLL